MPLSAIVQHTIRVLRYRQVESHLRACDTLVDLGCGRDYRFLKRNWPLARRCWGFDLAARDAEEGTIAIRRADITRPLPLTAHSVDCVTCLAVLEHLADPHPVLSECHRILRSGGRLIATTPSERGIHVHEAMRRLGLVRGVQEGEHKDFAMSKARLAAWFQRARLVVEAVDSFECGLNLVIIGSRS
jgi:SAM-dependent methyltransferase